MKNNNEVEWILIEDKLKKEWKKQDACKKEKKENNNIICFKNAKDRRKNKDKKFINENVPAVDAANLADYAVKYGFDTYNTTMILGNPDAHAAVTRLMKAISNAKGGAQKIYDDCIKNGFKSELGLFCEATGYLVPQTISTFKNNVTVFKDHFGKKRPKKKVPHFKDKEFKI